MPAPIAHLIVRSLWPMIGMELKAPPARNVSLIEAEILVHWHNRIPSISGSSTVFKDLPSASLTILLQYPFLIFEVFRGVAGDDYKEAGPLHLFAHPR